jgi:hypothetical protein
MKRSKLVLLLLFLGCLSNAQIYFQPYAGYMFSSHPTKTQSEEITLDGYSVHILKYKMGEGLNLGVIGGYRLNRYLSIELNACTHVFASFDNSVKQVDFRTVDYYYGSGFFGEDNYQNKIFQIAPQFVYTFSKNKFSVNLKMGPNFLKSKITHTLHYIFWEFDDWNRYPLNTIQETEYYSKFTVGFRSTVGIDYHVSSKVSASLSFVSVLNNSRFTGGEIKRYEIDGVSYMYKLEDKSIEMTEGEDRINFSQVGFVLGITYLFHNKN